MAVLSDREIKARVARGELVLGADPARAEECSYSFVPGAAFLPGSDSPAVEFKAGRAAEVVVRPGQMVWIRTRERVRIPNEIAGFWWQTNSLSRQGLMLVNMSMVEPGYEGDLACLFVNFGKNHLPIAAHTVIAKMVFHTIEGEVTKPYSSSKTREEYDGILRALSINQPESFLQIGSLAVDLQQAREEAISAIRSGGQDAAAEVKKAIEEAQRDASKAVSDARDAATKGFGDDVPKAIRGAFAGAAAGLALLSLAIVGAAWIKSHAFEDTKAIAKSAADDALGDRMIIAGTPANNDTVLLQRKIDALNERIAKLEKKR